MIGEVVHGSLVGRGGQNIGQNVEGLTFDWLVMGATKVQNFVHDFGVVEEDIVLLFCSCCYVRTAP